MTRSFQLDPAGAKFMGVASGIAKMTGTESLIIRLGLILAALVTGPVAVVLYVATGLLAPKS